MAGRILRTPRSRTGSAHADHAEAVVGVAEVGREARAVGDGTPRDLVPPGAAAGDAAGPGRWAGRGLFRGDRIVIVGVPVATPLVDAAGEIGQAEAVDRAAPHSQWPGERQAHVGEDRGGRRIAPRIARAVEPAPRRLLPLRLGGQAVGGAGPLAEPAAEGRGL